MLYSRFMQRRAFSLRQTTLILVALLAVRVCCASALPRPFDQPAPSRSAFMRFGQTLALADFDGDHRLDQATLSGSGRNKSLEVRLSHTDARTLLRFDTLTSERGSVFASDVDHDGDSDLVWTDLIHPDDIVIWLDDGSGRFERVCPDAYAGNLVLSDGPAFGYPEIPRQDVAYGSQRDPSPSLSPAPAADHSTPTKTFAAQWQRAPLADGCHRTTCNRGPPSLLS